jgi:hypothetical protein
MPPTAPRAIITLAKPVTVCGGTGALGERRAGTAQRQGPRRVYPGPPSRAPDRGPGLRGLHVPAYKGHLRSAGVHRLPCRPVFHKYFWLLKETAYAILFDGAEAVSWAQTPPEPLPPDYEPSCGTPAPHHYYRTVDPQHPAFIKSEAIWRQQRGLPAPVTVPRPACVFQLSPNRWPLPHPA